MFSWLRYTYNEKVWRKGVKIQGEYSEMLPAIRVQNSVPEPPDMSGDFRSQGTQQLGAATVEFPSPGLGAAAPGDFGEFPTAMPSADLGDTGHGQFATTSGEFEEFPSPGQDELGFPSTDWPDSGEGDKPKKEKKEKKKKEKHWYRVQHDFPVIPCN